MIAAAADHNAETTAAGAQAFATPPHVGVQQLAPPFNTFYLEDDNGVLCPLQNADCSDARKVSGVYEAGLDQIISGGALGSLPTLKSINNPDKLPGVRRGIARAIRGVDDARYANGPSHETLHLRNVYDRVIECLEETCAPQDLANAKRAYEDVLVTHVIHSIVRIHAANMDSDED